MIIYAPCPWICILEHCSTFPLRCILKHRMRSRPGMEWCWQGVLQDAGTSHGYPSTPLCVSMLNCSSGWWLGHLVKLCWPEEDWQGWNVTNDIGRGYCHALLQDLGVEIALCLGDLVTHLHVHWAGLIYLELIYTLRRGVGSVFFSFPNLHVIPP